MELNRWHRIPEDLKKILGADFLYPISNTGWDPSRRYITGTVLRQDGGTSHNSTIFVNEQVAAITLLSPEEEAKVEKLAAKAMAKNIEAFVPLGSDMTIGSDPEIFVVDDKDQVIPAFEFLPKDDPKAKVSTYTLFATSAMPSPYWDGFQAEFKIHTANCHAYVVDCIQSQLKRLHDLATKYNPKARLTGQPTHMIHFGVLDSAKPEHVELGCMPSLNAYGHTGKKPLSGRELPVRFAGFHIHHTMPPTTVEYDSIVKSIDNIAGVMSVAVLDGLEQEVRREYYGLAGEYRRPKYGLEYRVISSAALWHPALTHLHLDFVRAACQIGSRGLGRVWEGSPEETVSIINGLDVPQARKALKRNKPLMEALLKKHYGSSEKPSNVFSLVMMKGAKEFIELDVAKNWKFSSGWVSHSEAPACNMRHFIESLGE